MAAKKRLGRQTFDSARAAAKTFVDGNALFFDHVADPIDGLRAWADGIDVRTGKKTTRRLAETAAGRAIFEAPQGLPQIRAAVQWVMQQAPGRRWDAVDWDALNELGEQLAPHYEPPDREPGTPGIYWRPMVGAGRPVRERLDELEPAELVELGQEESHEGLVRALAELRETYAETRACLSPKLAAIVESRIAAWSRWEARADAIPEYACEPDEASGGYVCNYPLVEGELRELRGACRHAYRPDWFEAESDAGAAGFPPPAGDPRGVVPLPDEDEAPAGPRDDAPVVLDEPDELPCEPSATFMLAVDGRAYGAPKRDVADVRELRGVRYQNEWRTCGKSGCKCVARPPKRHGPYWYAYWRDVEGRRQSAYIGADFREIR